jgi:hypothetical protein
MKKAFLVAFAGVCVISSIMAGAGKEGKVISAKMENRMLRDTIPGKTDTSRYPKHDTTNLPRFADGQQVK